MTLNPNNPHYQALHQTNDDSCSDMMFVGPPPATLKATDKPRFYCLGRCTHPPIINTM